jgi:Na+/proline symporter
MLGNLFNKKSEISIKKLGFFQALGVAVYCLLVGALIQSGSVFFGPLGGILGPALMLILLSFSVLVCGLLVFYHPYQLFFDGKKKEAADLVLSTTGWLAAFFIVFFLLILLIG